MYNNKGNFRKGSNNSNKKPFNRGGQNSGNKHRPYNKSGFKGNNNRFKKSTRPSGFKSKIALAWADPQHYAAEVANVVSENDDKLTRYIRGRLYKGFHLYKVRVSLNNRFTSGFTFKTVGFLAFSDNGLKNTTNNPVVSMNFVPTDEVLELNNDLITHIELNAYIAGSKLLEVCGTACNFAIPSDLAKTRENQINAMGFKKDLNATIMDIFGEELNQKTGYDIFVANHSGIVCSISGAFHTDKFLKDFFKEHLDGYSYIIGPMDSKISIKDKNNTVVAEISKCEHDKDKKTRTIKYWAIDSINTTISKLIKKGIEVENEGHKTPYDPASKISIERGLTPQQQLPVYNNRKRK